MQPSRVTTSVTVKFAAPAVTVTVAVVRCPTICPEPLSDHAWVTVPPAGVTVAAYMRPAVFAATELRPAMRHTGVGAMLSVMALLTAVQPPTGRSEVRVMAGRDRGAQPSG